MRTRSHAVQKGKRYPYLLQHCGALLDNISMRIRHIEQRALAVNKLVSENGRDNDRVAVAI